MKDSLTYSDAGVDIDKGNQLVDVIKKIAASTKRTGAIGSIGGFGGLFALNTENIKNPVLISSTDGVGTKLKVAFMMDKHDTIGIDLVAMNVNDISVQGAVPLFFLDYISMGKLDIATAKDIVTGVAEGCKLAECALIGGETAEMPDLYNGSEYDLAGFAVGMTSNENIVDGSEIQVGNQLIGIASSGLHSNGYSLVRKICFDRLKLKIDSHIPELGKTIGEELLTPTYIYASIISNLLRDFNIRGLAHITGGGLPDNVVRIIPSSCSVFIRKKSWETPPIFQFLKEAGNVADEEMLRTFNNGIGLIAVIADDSVDEVIDRLTAMGVSAFPIGEIVPRKSADKQIKWV